MQQAESGCAPWKRKPPDTYAHGQRPGLVIQPQSDCLCSQGEYFGPSIYPNCSVEEHSTSPHRPATAGPDRGTRHLTNLTLPQLMPVVSDVQISENPSATTR